MAKILILPDNKYIEMVEGSTILELIRSGGIRITASCGGEQICGECKVRVMSGEALPPTELEKMYFSPEELNNSWRLACAHHAHDGMQVLIPDEERLSIEKVTSSTLPSHVSLQPLVEKILVKVTPESLYEKETVDSFIHDNLPDNGSIYSLPLSLQRKLPYLINSNGAHELTLVHNTSCIIDIEKGDTTGKIYGIALDIGTTTIAGLLIDLHTGETVGAETRVNEQITYGADVMSRIYYVLQNKDGVKVLAKSVRNTINEILISLAKNNKISPKYIYQTTVVGNPTMLHLFQEISPQKLAHAPYLPVTKSSNNLTARELGLKINPRSMVYVFPVLSGFVGGDTIGMIVSTRIYKSEAIRLAIDLGTNGEVVIGSSQRLIASATAAGPAFEGTHISCGMPAIKGAINSFHLDETGGSFRVIGGGVPRGLCGSGLIDTIAELLKYGIIDESGRIRSKENLKDLVPNQLLDRLIPNGSTFSFMITGSENKDIIVTQQDVREFQLAKGAIYAGTIILTKLLGVSVNDIEEIIIAGTFGSFMRKESLQRVGLLPSVPLSKISIVGNAACLGAKRVLINQSEQKNAETIAASVEHINLADRADFQEEFMNALTFPRQDSIQL